MSRAAGVLLGATALALVVSLRRRRDDPAQLVARYYDAWGRGDAEALRKVLADDYRGHVHALAGTEERDADALAALLESHSDAFEWTEFDVRDVVRDDGRLAARVAMRARHRETAREGEIEGLVITPEGDGPFPLVVNVHGGPEWAWSNSFLDAPTSLLVGRGYAMLLPNPRGSTGRGRKFAELVNGDPSVFLPWIWIVHTAPEPSASTRSGIT